jgi:hypothetical protein
VFSLIACDFRRHTEKLRKSDFGELVEYVLLDLLARQLFLAAVPTVGYHVNFLRSHDKFAPRVFKFRSPAGIGHYRPRQTVAWWDVDTLGPQQPFPGVSETAGNVAVSPNGNWGAAAGHRQDLIMWHAKTQEEKSRAEPRLRRNGFGYFAVALSSDSKY